MAWMWMPYFAEFLGTLLFLLIILLTLQTISGPSVLIALLIGLGLFIGIYLSGLIGGPGYLNPAVALLLGVRNNKSAFFTLGMVIVELVAALVAIAVVLLWHPNKKSCWLGFRCSA